MKLNYENMSDDELFKLMNDKKEIAEKAFSELYNRYSGKIYSYCRRFLGDISLAKDIFQDTFLKFYNISKEEKEMPNVSAYLLTIAHNLCINAKKREKSHYEIEDYMVTTIDTRHENDELLDLIHHAMELLPDEYKEVFILREYQGLSYQETSEILHIPPTTVKIRLFRARNKIREILAPYLADLSKY